MNKRLILTSILTSALFLAAGRADDQAKKQITVWSCPDAWRFLASLVRGDGLHQALIDLNDLPAISGFEPQGGITLNIKELFSRFMGDLPQAENQRFLSPQVSEELDSVLRGVAAGTVTPDDGLKRVQAAADKALGKN
jgi:raffinose/stachyose/melibiose transport system substrate-binding protein